MYSDIRAARSAFSSVVSIAGYERLSGYSLVSRFVKRAFNRNASLPKYFNF